MKRGNTKRVSIIEDATGMDTDRPQSEAPLVESAGERVLTQDQLPQPYAGVIIIDDYCRLYAFWTVLLTSSILRLHARV